MKHTINAMDSKALYLRLLTYVRPYWKAFGIAVFCMALSSVVEPAFPALMKYLLDDGFSKAQEGMGWLLYPAGIIGIFVARAVLGMVGDYAMSWVAQNVMLVLREEMFARLIRLPTKYYLSNLSGHLASKIANDVGGVTGATTGALTTLVKDSLSIIGLLAWLLYLNWQLTLIAFAIFPFVAFIVKSLGGRMRYLARGMQSSQGKITQVLQESIEGYKVIKIFGGERYEQERFTDAAREQRSFNMRGTVTAAIQGPMVQFFAALALAIIMGVAIKQAANDEATVGSFVSFITAMLMLLAPLKRLTDINAPIQRGLAAAESVFSLLDEPAEEDLGKTTLGRASGSVVFEHVRFSYPGSNKATLQDISFTIQPGECVALVGPSGSGKTTVAGLLPRFYDPDSGAIHIDGHAIASITLKSLRDNIALVSQEVVLFNDTIAANISYGSSTDKTLADIKNAAKAANALAFIEALPEGFDTLIGEHGFKLSGGQRQRLAIARAILKDAPILILDEATSALDTESERLVQAALETLMQGRTTLVIAHRLSTIERASRILVIQHGAVAESGSHTTLLSQNGIYRRLYDLHQLESAE